MKQYAKVLMARPLLLMAVIHIIAIVICFQINEYLGLNSFYDEYKPDNPMSTAGLQEGDTSKWYGKIADIRHKRSEDEQLNILILSDVYWESELLTTPGKYIQVYVEDDSKAKIGQVVCVEGRIDYYNHSRNQGEFESYRYYRNRGYLFCVRDGQMTEYSDEYSRLSNGLHVFKHICENKIDSCFEQEDASILKAMLLGVKEELNEETKELFQKSGVAHILAISGLHISFLCMAVYKALIHVGISMKLSILFSEIILSLYVLMVGFSPSAFRASIMFSLFLIAKILNRSYDMISAMSISSIAILLINPGYLYDASFQLSFLAILSVAFFYPNFTNNTRYLMQILKKHPSISIKGRAYNFFVVGGLNSLLVSAWVYLISLPVILCCYYETAIYAVLLNILVIPLMPVLLLCAIGTLMMTGRVNIFAAHFALLVKSTLNLYKKSCLLLEKIGLGRANLGRPAMWTIVIFYILLLVICLYRGRRRVIVQMASLAICILLMTIKIDTNPKLHMLDVGQGDSIIWINSNRNVYIFDGGSSSKNNVGKNRIIPFLKYHGINRIEAVFLSHPDADHINGIHELLEYAKSESISINCIYVYNKSLINGEYELLLDTAKKSGVKVEGIEYGYELEDGKMIIKCIYPLPNMSIDSSNDSSLILSLEYGDFRFLETGDAEKYAETVILCQKTLSSVDVLKVAHHGSSSSSSEEFIRVVKPQYALISAGRGNRYGHPHAETIEVLQENGSKIVQTKDSGQITINIGKKGSKYSVYTYVK